MVPIRLSGQLLESADRVLMKRSNVNIGSLDLELAVVDTSVPVQKKYCNQLNRHLRDYVTYGESLMQQVYKFKEEH